MAKTGIELTQQALNAFLRAKSASDSLLSSNTTPIQPFSQADQLRWLKVRILLDQEPPVMDLVETHPLSSSIEDDYNAMSESCAREGGLLPCYFFFRLDSTVEGNSSTAYEWLLIWYVPERAKVREKMLYSSSMAGLKTQIGFSNSVYGVGLWAGDYHTVSLEDLKYKNFNFVHKSQRHIHDIELYTEQERQKIMEEKEAFDQVEKQAASTVTSSSPTTSSTAPRGVEFPFEPSAQKAIDNFVRGSSMMVVLKVDIENEKILLCQEHKDSSPISVDELKQMIADNEPRYIFFHFEYEHEEADSNKKTVFIYSCPTKSKVKQRMLASASKSHVLSTVTASDAVKVEASLEISDVSDLTHDFLVKYLHPPKQESATKFSKPKRPGRGTARVAKDEEK
ncbi:hypothetical protein C9374_013231 [Naegleria lovaniensis]|uniref:ADF-H domain-containing protein n=1 Tax=Naegleria lovaniensis TaxID=51637 RepID=A0AA88KPP6_NAELO|nr:uncharacterized protein C9374_013231 [Naegleria lovaniensis]KAG2391746.1 hypothetical protein C9374_013231 [Naegleria lovaniensis]